MKLPAQNFAPPFPIPFGTPTIPFLSSGPLPLPPPHFYPQGFPFPQSNLPLGPYPSVHQPNLPLVGHYPPPVHQPSLPPPPLGNYPPIQPSPLINTSALAKAVAKTFIATQLQHALKDLTLHNKT